MSQFVNRTRLFKPFVDILHPLILTIEFMQVLNFNGRTKSVKFYADYLCIKLGKMYFNALMHKSEVVSDLFIV